MAAKVVTLPSTREPSGVQGLKSTSACKPASVGGSERAAMPSSPTVDPAWEDSDVEVSLQRQVTYRSQKELLKHAAQVNKDRRPMPKKSLTLSAFGLLGDKKIHQLTRSLSMHTAQWTQQAKITSEPSEPFKEVALTASADDDQPDEDDDDPPFGSDAVGLHFVVNAKRYTEKTTRWTHDFATERHVVNTQLDEHFDRLENKLCEIETYQHMTHNMVDTTLKRLYDEYEALEQKAKHLLERQRPLRHALEQILAASDDPPEVARNSRDTDEWPYASTI